MTCDAPEHHQFDFFLGDWDAYDVGDPTTIVARNRVTRVLGGCALREVYEQTDGLVGESLSAYDTGRGVWHQSWMTNRGGILLLDDGLDAAGRMVLVATETAADGEATLLRGAWWVEGEAVRERAERSADGGVTWAPVFDLVFLPHAER